MKKWIAAIVAVVAFSATVQSVKALPNQKDVSSANTKTAANQVVVKPGDSLWVIAERYHVTLDALRRANPRITERPRNTIYAGEKLVVPNVEVMTAEEREIWRLINVERAKAGLAALGGDYGALNRSARVKADEMAATGVMSHYGAMGSPFEQMRSMNVQYTAAAENVAMGQQTPAEVVKAWMNSPGHRQNILGKYTHCGIGVAISDAGKFYAAQFVKKIK